MTYASYHGAARRFDNIRSIFRTQTAECIVRCQKMPGVVALLGKGCSRYFRCPGVVLIMNDVWAAIFICNSGHTGRHEDDRLFSEAILFIANAPRS